MKRGKHLLLLSLTLLALWPHVAMKAQQAVAQITAAQQTITHPDAATNVITIGAASTVSVTPPNGQYVYITGIDITSCADGTGGATTNANVTTANLNGVTIEVGGTNAAGACTAQSVPLSVAGGVLKSAASGTLTSFTLPAFGTHQTIRLNAYYYFGY